MNEFLNAMAELDMALTGKDREASTAQFHHMPQTPEDWFAKGDLTWYLSDAGYSRVVFGSERGRLFLTSNSTQRVKARWEAAAPQRQRVEEIMRGWMTSNGWDIPFSEALAHKVVTALLEWGGMFSNWHGYWMTAGGDMQRVDDHVSWARRWLAANHPEALQNDASGTGPTGKGIYESMRKYGWFRVVVENNKIYVKPQNATRSQMARIQEMAIENRLTVVDELTLRTIYDPRDDHGGMED